MSRNPMGSRHPQPINQLIRLTFTGRAPHLNLAWLWDLSGPPPCQYQLVCAFPLWGSGDQSTLRLIVRVGPIKMATSLSQRITTNWIHLNQSHPTIINNKDFFIYCNHSCQICKIKTLSRSMRHNITKQFKNNSNFAYSKDIAYPDHVKNQTFLPVLCMFNRTPLYIWCIWFYRRAIFISVKNWILHQSGRRRRREQLNSGQCYKFININKKKRIQHMH